MGYIGNNLQQQVTQPATQFFSGNGSTTSFTLNQTPQSVYTVEVVVNNVQQNPQTSYYVTGNTLIFYSAPPSGSSNIYVNYNPIIAYASLPGYGTVGSSQLGNISTINNNAGSLNLQTNGTTALAIDQNQFLNIGNSGNLSLAKLHVALTDRVRNSTLMNANNTNTLLVLSAPFSSPELTANSSAKWGILFSGNGDFNATPASLPTAVKSAGIFAVSEDTGAGYNRKVGIAIHTCNSDAAHGERLRVSGDGYMTNSYQPYSYARCAYQASYSLVSGQTHIMQYNSSSVNTGNCYNTGNYRFTCPVAGKYFVYAHAQLNGPTMTTWGFNFGIWKNGGIQDGVYESSPGANDYRKVSVSGIVPAAANDYIDIRLIVNVTSGSIEYTSPDQRFSFHVYLLG